MHWGWGLGLGVGVEVGVVAGVVAGAGAGAEPACVASMPENITRSQPSPVLITYSVSILCPHSSKEP